MGYPYPCFCLGAFLGPVNIVLVRLGLPLGPFFIVCVVLES